MKFPLSRQLPLAVILAVSYLSISLPGHAADTAVSPVRKAPQLAKTYTVRTPDGVSIAVKEWGNPNGPEIVFIHGISQSHLSWSRQISSDLARNFRLITYDLRGHGSSDKPLTPKSYQDSKLWAGELEAVLNVTQAKRPVLVGWSYGGLIISDYLKTYGEKRLAGAVYLDAMIKLEAGPPTVATRALARMTSADLATNIAGTTEFLHACFAKQPSKKDFETMLAFNMLTPPEIRKAMVNRVIDYDEAAKRFALPVLVIHGAKDIPMPIAAAKHTAATIPGARLVIFESAGHSPFFEDAPRFNKVLTDFLGEVDAKRRPR
jgi:non-heme chloroperoxidase